MTENILENARVCDQGKTFVRMDPRLAKKCAKNEQLKKNAFLFGIASVGRPPVHLSVGLSIQPVTHPSFRLSVQPSACPVLFWN